MPCNSNHMEPTARERQHSKAATLLVYALKAMDKPVHASLLRDAIDIYGGQNGEASMAALCTLLRSMTDEQRNRIVYDGRNPMARRLADWWDKHQAEDALAAAAANDVPENGMDDFPGIVQIGTVDWKDSKQRRPR